MNTASSIECPPVALGERARIRVGVRGTVQGVGFRPFIYRIAKELGLAGWVSNSLEGATIEADGSRESFDRLLERIESEKPPFARISDLDVSYGPCSGFVDFEIRESEHQGPVTASILADLATCKECRAEIFDPANRRYRYPFTNCTQCGPRFSIIESLPYDRANTSMSGFPMCPECSAEYRDPSNRRFHAQPNACSRCGPRAALWDASGVEVAACDEAIRKAAQLLKEGAIVALKGIGGFQLLTDACDDACVQELRRRKGRPDKPFAVMFPSPESVARACFVSEGESVLLSSAAAPIVLLRSRNQGAEAGGVSPWVARNNPQLGAMLPYSPLHHLLMADVAMPLVATSGNLSEEPLCVDETEATERLSGIADYFLVHNRPIVRPVDDSVERELLGREQVVRRARGHAPLPIRVACDGPTVIAFGADLKNTVALGIGRDVFVSQHIGDLESPRSRWAFRRAACDLPRLYCSVPEIAACDLHPGYASTQYARGAKVDAQGVQHHYAHVLACMAEHGIDAPVLGICWDGTGYGDHGSIWGGEFLAIDSAGFRRVGFFLPFALTGGDAAAREPRRSALAVLQATFGDSTFEHRDLETLQAFSAAELNVLKKARERGVNTAVTTSAGRLFDAVASLAGLCQRSSFEGQAAMDLEFAILPGEQAPYPFRVATGAAYEYDWRPTVEAIVLDLEEGASAGRIASRFHSTLVEVIQEVARRVGIEDVALTGGCFQNRWLAENAARKLHGAGFKPHWPQRIPPNDGGIALGQVVAARRSRAECEGSQAPLDSLSPSQRSIRKGDL